MEKSIIHALNSFHLNIKFTSTISTTELQYLDTVVYKQDNKLHTKIFNKPTDCKQYLHYTSNHPQHTKLSIPYSQAITPVALPYDAHMDFIYPSYLYGLHMVSI